MNDDKHLIIYFNNGTKMEMSFPTQIKNSLATVMEAIKRILESDKLVTRQKSNSSLFPGPASNISRRPRCPGQPFPLAPSKGPGFLPPTNAPQNEKAPPPAGGGYGQRFKCNQNNIQQHNKRRKK